MLFGNDQWHLAVRSIRWWNNIYRAIITWNNWEGKLLWICPPQATEGHHCCICEKSKGVSRTDENIQWNTMKYIFQNVQWNTNVTESQSTSVSLFLENPHLQYFETVRSYLQEPKLGMVKKSTVKWLGCCAKGIWAHQACPSHNDKRRKDFY